MNKVLGSGRVFSLFICFALALPLGLTLLQRHHTILWKITLAVRTFGHWAGLILLLWAALELGIRKPRRWVFASSLVTLALLYLLPLFWALSLPAGKFSLAKAYGFGDPAPPWAVKTLDFGKRDGEDLKLDLYMPKSATPVPFVVVIHGGGWDSGDRSQLPELNRHLAVRGIAVATVDYSLAPKWKWPAQREDVLDAIAFLQKNANRLGLDANRWVILGRSAGGQIAECVALDSPPAGLCGCIAFYAPSDLDFAYRLADPHDLLESQQLLINYLGGTPDEKPQAYADASALRYVSSHSVPTLLLHGPDDPLVWYRHNERLQAAMNAKGVRCEFLSLPLATHGFDFSLRSPEGQVGTSAVDAFLDSIFAAGASPRQNTKK